MIFLIKTSDKATLVNLFKRFKYRKKTNLSFKYSLTKVHLI